MQDEAIFIFAPGENHITYLERVFQSIAKHITINYTFCVLLPNDYCSVRSAYPVVTKVISNKDLDLCNNLYLKEGRTDIPPFATYAQLLLPKYFPEYKKFLFMEVDQIVQKDLAPLWRRVFFEDIKLGAVVSRNSDGSFAEPPVSFQKVAPNGYYFNMGVVLVDTKFWQENNFSEKCFLECRIQKNEKGKRFDFYAQGAMNNALHTYVTDLGFEYNLTGLGYKSDYKTEILNNAVILHWSGSRKPWLPGGLYKERYFEEYSTLVDIYDWIRFALSHRVRIFYKTEKLIRRLLNISEEFGLFLKKSKLVNTSFGRYLIDAILLPSDVFKIIHFYKKNYNKHPDLINPKTFNEKLQQSKLLNRKSHYIKFADKIAVREYVEQQVGAGILTKLYWTGENLLDARHIDLPNKFIIKANQGSGTNIIVSDKNSFDWESASHSTQKWLKKDHSTHNAEWQYRWIPPKLLIEEYLEDTNGNLPVDYKFFCFHGKVAIVQVDFDRFTNHTRALFDQHFNRLPVTLQYPQYNGIVTKPKCFEEMKGIAECLAKNERFIRVDLYDIGKPIFGELTLHPEAGCGIFNPPEWDENLGNLI